MIEATVSMGNNVRDLDEWQQNSNPWTVTLSYEGRELTVPFWTGQGWTREPDAHDVIQCLCSDAAGYENAGSFEYWAAEYGYDEDSRKAFRTWGQVGCQTRKLRAFLGSDFDAFVDADDEELEAIINFEDTQEEIRQRFETEVAPSVIETYGEDDTIALDEAFNNWTDSLCKDGEISDYIYERITRQ